MNRLKLINAIFNATDFKNYIEIGCYKGKTFFNVKADLKIAVDPSFHRSFYLEVFKRFFKSNVSKTKIFKMTSEVFFVKQKTFLTINKPIDLALIDGLHTFKASLNDVFNTLKYLQQEGVIVLHDCNPPNAGAAMQAVGFPSKVEQSSCNEWTGAWCGDVWKTIVYLKQHHSDSVDVKVIDSDSGLGIVTLKPGVKSKSYSIDSCKFRAIDVMTYNDLKKNRKTVLSLQSVPPFVAELKLRYPNIVF